MMLRRSSAMPALSCPRMRFAIAASFRPTAGAQWPSARNLLLPNFHFMLACLSDIISGLSPFR